MNRLLSLDEEEEEREGQERTWPVSVAAKGTMRFEKYVCVVRNMSDAASYNNVKKV